VQSLTSSGCWTCLCTPSVRQVGDGNGLQTTYWAGEQCQKQDISMQFHLFFWFTIALVLTVVVGVKLLWSVGEEEMGGVLGSGVSPVKKH